jgi:hypothetical protein
MIVLYKEGIDPEPGEILLVIGFEKKSAIVTKYPGLQQ